MNSIAYELLLALVKAMDNAFISSWQSTAGWQKELDEAKEFINRTEEAKS